MPRKPRFTLPGVPQQSLPLWLSMPCAALSRPDRYSAATIATGIWPDGKYWKPTLVIPESGQKIPRVPM